MTQDDITTLFQRLQQHNKNPTTELHYQTTFELLIAVMLSAQATDVSVNKATHTLFKRANTPQAILALGEEGLKHYIKTIGLYNRKAKHIIQTCEQLIKYHQEHVPKTRKALQLLPGVGRKTANVVLNVAFGHKTIAVDTHIFRVANRTGLAPGDNPLAVEKKLLQTIPESFKQHAHHLLILHGRYTCIAKKPKCFCCIIYDLCQYQNKTKT